MLFHIHSSLHTVEYISTFIYLFCPFLLMNIFIIHTLYMYHKVMRQDMIIIRFRKSILF